MVLGPLTQCHCCNIIQKNGQNIYSETCFYKLCDLLLVKVQRLGPYEYKGERRKTKRGNCQRLSSFFLHKVFAVHVAKLCLTFCDPMDFTMPVFPVLRYLSEFAQTHVH